MPPIQKHSPKRQEIRRNVESVALKLFSVKGFDNVTADEVALTAGISPRTFFRYFPTKVDVLLAIPIRILGNFCRAVEARPLDEPLLKAWSAAAKTGGYWDKDDLKAVKQLRAIESQCPGIQDRLMAHPVITQYYIDTVAHRLQVDPETDLRPVIYGAAIQSAIMTAISRWDGGQNGNNFAEFIGELFVLLAELPTAIAADATPRKRAKRQ